MRFFRVVSFCAALGSVIPTSGQDSLQVLELNDFLNIVLNNHPVIKQAELQPNMADASLLMAKGKFDPKLELTRDIKKFDKKDYWDDTYAALKIPTWIPIDPKFTFESRTGEFLDESESIPEENNNRQLTAGVSIPLGRGLFIDERRAIIKQANIYQDIAAAEQLKMANKLLFTVIKDYMNWSLAFQELNLLQQSVTIAEELYRRVKLDYDFGEAASVDTVQALITLQKRQTDYQKALFNFQASGYTLSNHLWREDRIPLEIKENTIPDTTSQFGDIPDQKTIFSFIEWAMANHPEIQMIQGKTEQLNIDRRLAKEFLKPQVDLSYSFIDAPVNPTWTFEKPSFHDNYKLGMDLYLPLLLRKERGKLKLNELKVRDINFELDFLKQNITNEINTRYAELIMAQRLTEQYRLMAANYKSLLEAEFLNLETGESDLFKLNIQQDKFIESQLKYLFNLIKFQKLKAQILYDAGNLSHSLKSASS
ncbi:MAG: TolC family protein [Crocinitomicaceae bacterium]